MQRSPPVSGLQIVGVLHRMPIILRGAGIAALGVGRDGSPSLMRQHIGGNDRVEDGLPVGVGQLFGLHRRLFLMLLHGVTHSFRH